MNSSVVSQLQALAKLNPNQEICGIIGSDHTIYPVHNVAKASASCFIFDKREYFALIKQFKDTGVSVLCIYHSHPSGDVTPSKADRDYTKRSGIPQIIVSPTRYYVVDNA